MAFGKFCSLLNLKIIGGSLVATLLLVGPQGFSQEKVLNPITTNIDYYPLKVFFEYMDKQDGLLTFKNISPTQFRIALNADKAETKDPGCRARSPKLVFEFTDLGGINRGAKVEFLVSESEFKGKSFKEIILSSSSTDSGLFKFVVLGNPGAGGIDILNITLGMSTVEEIGEEYDDKSTYIQLTKTHDMLSVMISDLDQDYESNTLVTSVKEFSSTGAATYKKTLSCN